MYRIIEDSTLGTINISDYWVLGATGLDAPPQFENLGDQVCYSFSSLVGVKSFNSFTYSTYGEFNNRFLITFYRVSRDYTNWTQWLELDSNIQNFPPFNSNDLMYIDIKFVRAGTSIIDNIYLLSYSLNGYVPRLVVDGSATLILNKSYPEAILKPPFIYKVFSITDIL